MLPDLPPWSERVRRALFGLEPPRPGHGVFLISGDGQTRGSWAACSSQDYRLVRVDGAGQAAAEAARSYPIPMMGDSAILASADGLPLIHISEPTRPY